MLNLKKTIFKYSNIISQNEKCVLDLNSIESFSKKESCKDFLKIDQLLNKRENELMKLLNENFDQREDKIKNEIELLNPKLIEAKNTFNHCYNSFEEKNLENDNSNLISSKNSNNLIESCNKIVNQFNNEYKKFQFSKNDLISNLQYKNENNNKLIDNILKYGTISIQDNLIPIITNINQIDHDHNKNTFKIQLKFKLTNDITIDSEKIKNDFLCQIFPMWQRDNNNNDLIILPKQICNTSTKRNEYEFNVPIPVVVVESKENEIDCDMILKCQLKLFYSNDEKCGIKIESQISDTKQIKLKKFQYKCIFEGMVQLQLMVNITIKIIKMIQ